MYFLQKTITDNKKTFLDFYATISDKLPEAKILVDSMKKHDSIDMGLSHESDFDELINKLFARNTITYETVHSASTVVQLLWSFLDGIRSHYTHGDIAVLQRLGWHSEL